jgi:hypothetical protein
MLSATGIALTWAAKPSVSQSLNPLKLFLSRAGWLVCPAFPRHPLIRFQMIESSFLI